MSRAPLCGAALLSLALLPSTSAAQVLDRAGAASALLAPTSGVTVDLTDGSIWSPNEDFGFGPGNEGLLPAGSLVSPYLLGELPATGSVMPVVTDSYVFWIDDDPGSRFQHPTRFVLVDANDPAPTLANGGIRVTDQGWWPEIARPGGFFDIYFEGTWDRVSDSPPGPFNPDGLIAGIAPSSSQIVIPPPPPPGQQGGGNACGLLARGSRRPGPIDEFDADINRWENDLRNHYGVPANRIVKANGGNPATKQQFCDALDQIVNANPPCDKIYVRLTSHGNNGSFSFADGPCTAADLCEKFKKLAALGVPICLIIEACHSGSLLDAHNWNFPAGSSIIVSAAADKNSYGYSYETPGGDCFTGSCLPYGHSACLNDTTDADGDGKKDADTNCDGIVDDVEAFKWLQKVKPCYTLKPTVGTPNPKMRYPVGPPTGTPGENPGPSVTEVGRDPKKLNINVCNGTGEDKTAHYIRFKGDVSDGIPIAWRSDGDDNLGDRWGDGDGESTATYDPETDTTLVCWTDPDDPIKDGEYLHVGFFGATNGLRPVREWWATVPGATPTDKDKVPAGENKNQPNDDHTALEGYVIFSDEANGGWDGEVQVELTLRVSPVDIPIEHLALGDPFLQDLPVVSVPIYLAATNSQLPYSIAMPGLLPSDHWLIVETATGWSLNATTTTQLALFDPVDHDYPEGPWFSLGAGLQGSHGTPVFTGNGELSPGSTYSLSLTNAAYGGVTYLVVGSTLVDIPFAGGVVHPSPDTILGPYAVGRDGVWSLTAVWPAGLPAGVPLHMQHLVPDAGAVQGWALSNGLTGTSQ